MMQQCRKVQCMYLHWCLLYLQQSFKPSS